MDKLKLNIQKFALNPPTAGNLIDEVCLHRYHQNIKRDYAKKGSDNNFANLVVDSIRTKNLYNKDTTYVSGVNNQNINNTILLKPNTNYYFKTGKGYTEVKLYDSSGIETRSLGGGSSTTTEIGFTTQSNEVKAILIFFSGQSNVDISTFDFTGIQLEEGTTATTYAPYQNLNPNIIRLDMFDDTSGSNWQDMMKNKIDYCIDTIDTNRNNVETFINGGWSGVNYGFGVFSKIGNVYQLTWYSIDGIYYCRKLDNGVYNYRNINILDSGWQDITLQNGVTARSGDAYKPQYRKIGNVVYIKGQVNIPSHNSTIAMCSLPSGYRPTCETRMPLMLPYVTNWIDTVGSFNIASSGALNNINIDTQYVVN